MREVSHLDRVIEKLCDLVKKERGSALTDSERCDLKEFVVEAIERYKSPREPVTTLHEIVEPLDHVISILKYEPNRDAVLVALGSPIFPGIGGPKVKLAETRYRRLLADLRNIAFIAPSPPDEPGKGKPPDERFHDLIRSLASYWKHVTGKRFRQANRPEAFVTAIVELIDPDRSPKKTIRKIIAERKKRKIRPK